MSRFTRIDEALHDYMVERGAREDDVLAAVREETAALGSVAVMQIAPDQGAFMTMLMKLVRGDRPGRAIEVGTFTGYSAICLARGLGRDGVLIACELDPDRAEQAGRNFERAGVADRVDLRIGPAAETLDGLVQEAWRDGEEYDLAFIAADKTGYDSYYEKCLRLLRPDGMIVLDNVLQDGRVLDPGDDESAVAIDTLNAKVRDDDRVEIAMVGVADGLTLARKK